MSLFDFTLAIGDDALIAAQRLGEWTSRAPEMEEDIALANIALDQLGVGGVQAADVGVRQATAGPHEDLPQGRGRAAHAATAFRSARFAAYAAAASRTHAPSACALRRCAMRSLLHGPLPLMTRISSS